MSIQIILHFKFLKAVAVTLPLKSRPDTPSRCRLPTWKRGNPLTKEVGICPYAEGESVSWFMNPEEDHGHILGRSDAPSAQTTVTEIYVPLSCGERMILGTGELLPLENPTIKYLPTKNTDIGDLFHQLLKSQLC